MAIRAPDGANKMMKAIFEPSIIIITDAALRQFEYYKSQHCLLKSLVQTHNIIANSMPLPSFFVVFCLIVFLSDMLHLKTCFKV